MAHAPEHEVETQPEAPAQPLEVLDLDDSASSATPQEAATEDGPTAVDPLELERLRSRIALLAERVRAAEALAPERAARVADLRIVLRMLPAASELSHPEVPL